MKLDLPKPRPCFFVGSSKSDLLELPVSVRQSVGYAIHEAQLGDEPLDAKALKGFGGRSVLEIVKDFDTDTYRAVYTVRFSEALYVLHVFQKKSRKGAAWYGSALKRRSCTIRSASAPEDSENEHCTRNRTRKREYLC